MQLLATLLHNQNCVQNDRIIYRMTALHGHYILAVQSAFLWEQTVFLFSLKLFFYS